MLYHGSPYELSVGDTLLPGVRVGKNINGGCSKFVYATGDFGYSMSDVERMHSIHNIRQYAIWDAIRWGWIYGEKDRYWWLYAVEGEIQGIDDHFDVSPGSYKLNSATIVHRVNMQEEDMYAGLMEMYTWSQEYSPF